MQVPALSKSMKGINFYSVSVANVLEPEHRNQKGTEIITATSEKI